MLINKCLKFHAEDDKKRLFERRDTQTSPEVLLGDWKRLLDTAKREQDVQDFLERRPDLLPGLIDLHNGPLHGIVVTKFPFGADYKCDFAFITRHSMAMQFTLIEIEDPAKPIFNKDGSFSQAFNRARQQIADWRVWVDKNMATLVDMFSPMFETYHGWDDVKTFRTYLVYGRREEAESDKLRKERWSSLQATIGRDIIIMSYDRITSSIEQGSYKPLEGQLVVCTYEDRSFFVKSKGI